MSQLLKAQQLYFLCVASPGCTGFSPLQLSGINVHIIPKQPPWFPIQLKFVLVVFKSCLRHASGSLIEFVSLCSSSCSSWLSSTWFPVSLQELCVCLEIFTRTIHLNKKWFGFMLHSHPFGSSIEGGFASRSICRRSKFEGYRSEYSWNMNASICKESQFWEVHSSNWEAERLSHDLCAHPKFETHFTF